MGRNMVLVCPGAGIGFDVETQRGCDHLRMMVELVAFKAKGSVGSYQGVKIRVWQSFHAKDYAVERHY